MELDVLVGNIRADAKRIRLLDILGQQLRLLITDLDSLLSSLKAEALVSEEDCGDLKLTFALETVRERGGKHRRLFPARIWIFLSISDNCGPQTKKLGGNRPLKKS